MQSRVLLTAIGTVYTGLESRILVKTAQVSARIAPGLVNFDQLRSAILLNTWNSQLYRRGNTSLESQARLQISPFTYLCSRKVRDKCRFQSP